jgi:anion-transporting  ArsA/GET3 family ATPase
VSALSAIAWYNILSTIEIIFTDGRGQKMSIKQSIWSLDTKEELSLGELVSERELEEIIANDISILNPNWILIGQQIRTFAGGFIDLLCVDGDGDCIVVELKKNLTPREVTAQAIDYASCVRDMTADNLAEEYIKYHGEMQTIDDAYEEKFGQRLDAANFNTNVKIVIVAAKMDDSTERIIKYLQDFNLNINILFFSVFGIEGKRLLSRAWLIDDSSESLVSGKSISHEWNGEFYVNFGVEENCRSWADAKKYGFVSAGGAEWYTKTLNNLSIGDRVWVNIPQVGFAGVGFVEDTARAVSEAKFEIDGVLTDFLDLDLDGDYIWDTKEEEEYVVKISWEYVVDMKQAVREIGFFGNQNTVCSPTSEKWEFTIKRLKSLWGIK